MLLYLFRLAFVSFTQVLSQSGGNRMSCSLSGGPPKECAALRAEVREAEGHLREPYAMKGAPANDEITKVVLIQFVPYEFRFHVRRQGLRSDTYSQ